MTGSARTSPGSLRALDSLSLYLPPSFLIYGSRFVKDKTRTATDRAQIPLSPRERDTCFLICRDVELYAARRYQLRPCRTVSQKTYAKSSTARRYLAGTRILLPSSWGTPARKSHVSPGSSTKKRTSLMQHHAELRCTIEFSFTVRKIPRHRQTRTPRRHVKRRTAR